MDGWRTIALVVIVLHNTSYVFQSDGSTLATLFRTAAAAGWSALTIFFVVSGFLVTRSLIRHRHDGLQRFYLRRLLRVVPLYYLMLALAVVVLPVISPRTIDATNKIWYWLYLSNWIEADSPALAHLWSLGVAEWFYMAWPILVWRLPLSRLWFLTAALVALGPSVRWSMHLLGASPATLYLSNFARTDEILMGCLLALTVHEVRFRTRLESYGRQILVGALLLLVALVIARSGLEPLDLHVQLFGQSLVAVSVTLLIYFCSELPKQPFPRMSAALRLDFFSVSARLTYAAFLIHLPVHALLEGPVSPVIARSPTLVGIVLTLVYGLSVLVISFLLAAVIWGLYERHVLAIRARFAPHRPG